ncbi:MAG TPA: GH3 auxin-responsive promoter family protein [Candidatus Binatia bacterium]|nr:GH3 auxin-responsive promoter family protein [Candidatus Binatia bacterium]
MNLAYWLNTAWMWQCRLELARFCRATQRVEFSQYAVLREILTVNATSEFGRNHGFAGIRSAAQFQRCVPLCDYEAISEDIERIGAGEEHVLTGEPIHLLEPTSGSSGAVKLIPYTASLREQFQRGIKAWLGDLLHAYPAVRQGRAYWSISPASGIKRKSRGGIAIGFADDTEYLGKLERWAIRYLLAVPPAVAKTEDLDQFRYRTLLHLLGAADLTLISIWSPTFLTALLGQIERRAEELPRDLRAIQPYARLRPATQRADDVARILDANQSIALKLKRIWPRLALISCWADGASAGYCSELMTLLPHVTIQPKGLLSTEGFVSLPLARRLGAALALRSHFFEFVDARGDLRLAHELERCHAYQMVITTGGGLYRYRTGDVVEVAGFENQCPLLRFVGRGDGVCDRIGEKLSEAQVRRALESAFAAQALAPRFAMLVPVERPQRSYRLYLQGRNGELTTEKLAMVRAGVEAVLAENPYYDHALRLGQLARLEVQALSSSAPPAWEIYENECLKRGQRLGDIKPVVLHGGSWWPEYFAPLTEARAPE